MVALKGLIAAQDARIQSLEVAQGEVISCQYDKLKDNKPMMSSKTTTKRGTDDGEQKSLGEGSGMSTRHIKDKRPEWKPYDLAGYASVY